MHVTNSQPQHQNLQAENAICTGSNPEINALFPFCQKRTVCKVFLLSIIDGDLQPKFSTQISCYRSRSPATILLKLPTNQPSCVPSAAVTATDNHYVTTTTTHKVAATSGVMLQSLVNLGFVFFIHSLTFLFMSILFN